MGKEKAPAVSGEGFGLDDTLLELEEETTETQTGDKPGKQATETVAPEEAGQTTGGEGGEGGTEEELILGKFKSIEDLKTSYQELEKSRSQLDQRRVELEANQQAWTPLIEQYKSMMEEKSKPKEEELTTEQYLQMLAENPRKAHSLILKTPEVREVINQVVNEIAKPYVEAQNKRAVKELYDKVGSEITVNKGYPIDFKDALPEIQRMAEKRPWLKDAAMLAVRDGEGESFLEYCYKIYLDDHPDLLKNWEGKKSATDQTIPPVTETGAPSSPKVKEAISEEEQTMRNIEAAAKAENILL
jgi:hypothetical protein